MTDGRGTDCSAPAGLPGRSSGHCQLGHLSTVDSDDRVCRSVAVPHRVLAGREAGEHGRV